MLFFIPLTILGYYISVPESGIIEEKKNRCHWITTRSDKFDFDLPREPEKLLVILKILLGANGVAVKLVACFKRGGFRRAVDRSKNALFLFRYPDTIAFFQPIRTLLFEPRTTNNSLQSLFITN